MKFLSTNDGYYNEIYIKRLFVKGTAIMMEDNAGAEHVHDDGFINEDAAQDSLDELIEELEELEDDDRPDSI